MTGAGPHARFDRPVRGGLHARRALLRVLARPDQRLTGRPAPALSLWEIRPTRRSVGEGVVVPLVAGAAPVVEGQGDVGVEFLRLSTAGMLTQPAPRAAVLGALLPRAFLQRAQRCPWSPYHIRAAPLEPLPPLSHRHCAPPRLPQPSCFPCRLPTAPAAPPLSGGAGAGRGAAADPPARKIPRRQGRCLLCLVAAGAAPRPPPSY